MPTDDSAVDTSAEEQAAEQHTGPLRVADLGVQNSAGAPAAGGRLLESLLAGVIPSLMAVVAYAVLREAYVWFYQRYGVAPEDVGITQVRMLTSGLRFVHLWTLTLPGTPVTNILLFILSAALLVLLWRTLLPRARRRSRRLDLFVARHPVILGLVVAIGLLLLTLAWALPIDRSLAGKRLQAGEAVQPEDAGARPGGCRRPTSSSASWSTRPTVTRHGTPESEA